MVIWIQLIAAVLIISGLSFLILAVYSLSRQQSGLSTIFALLCLAAAIYSFGYSFELSAGSREQILFALKVQFAGAPLIPPLFIFLAHYIKHRRSPSLSKVFLFMVPVMALQFLGLTNDYHQLIYRDVQMVQYTGFVLSDLQTGFVYPLLAINVAIAQLYGISTFYLAWREEKFKFRSYSFFLLIGTVIPGLSYLLTFFRLLPLKLDWTPLAMTFTVVFFSIAVFGFHLLAMSRNILDLIFKQSQEGIVVIDQNRRLIDANEMASQIFDGDTRPQIGQSIDQWSAGQHLSCQAGEEYEFSIDHPNQPKFYLVHSFVVQDQDKTIGTVFHIQDYTRQKQLLLELAHYATTDPLTQVLNRRNFIKLAQLEIERAIRYHHPLAMILFDLDHFKAINDQYGHLAGDEVLKSFARLCAERVRESDLICRFGGEEFVILLPETDQHGAFRLAEQIRSVALGQTIPYQDKSIRYQVSAGIAGKARVTAEDKLEQLFARADKALYQAKASGRNRVVIL